MRKLIVTCECGQRMQVARSAIGRTGICPTCGQTLLVTGDNTRPLPRGKGGAFSGQSWWRGVGEPPQDAKRQFGEAVDLYCKRRYAEALAIFNSLAKRFPNNKDIENGREQCISALKRPHGLALEHKGSPVADAKLDEETVKRVVLEKMLHGSTEAIQLQAAELAARILKMEGNGQVTHEEAEALQEKGHEESAEAADEAGADTQDTQIEDVEPEARVDAEVSDFEEDEAEADAGTRSASRG